MANSTFSITCKRCGASNEDETITITGGLWSGANVMMICNDCDSWHLWAWDADGEPGPSRDGQGLAALIRRAAADGTRDAAE